MNSSYKIHIKERISDDFKDLFFPVRCPLCDDVLEFRKKGLCEKCRYSMPYVQAPVCFRCGRELPDGEAEYCEDCLRRPGSLDGGFPLLKYIEPAASSVLRIKYNGRQEYAAFYAGEIADRYGESFKRLGVDAIIPVPLNRKKLKRRGFNQAELIAAELARLTGISLRTDILVRLYDTLPQKGLDKSERVKNLINAFGIKGTMDLKKILLVDDIYTTGATVEACSHVLKQGGAERVYYTSICIGSR